MVASLPQLGPDYRDIRPYDVKAGLGVLFLAHKVGLDTPVVIKKTKDAYQDNAGDRAEADILKRIKHRYLPTIYDLIRGDDGALYTVMEYIPGENMAQMVCRTGCQSQTNVIRWAKQLCEVTAYLHSQTPPIIHSDIKPGNVMITPQGDICLIDFNTSIEYYDPDDTQAKGVSNGYAAPEQYTYVNPAQLSDSYNPYSQAQTRLLDDATQTMGDMIQANYGLVGPHTDVYGIGATLYFLLTGQAPQLSLMPLVPIDQWDITLDPMVAYIVSHALEKPCNKRFSTALDMGRALERIQTSNKRWKRYVASCRLLAMGLCACMALSVGAIWLGWTTLTTERTTAYQSLVTHGSQLSNAGDYEGAYTSLLEAVQLLPDRLDAYNALANSLYRQGNYSECVTLMTRSLDTQTLELSDDSATLLLADIYYILGNCYLELTDYPSAISYFYAAKNCCPDNSDYLRDYAIALARNQNFSQASDALSVFNTTFPASNDGLLISGELAAQQGQYDQALTYYLQVIEHNSNAQTLARTYLLAAQCYSQLGSDTLDGQIALLEQGCAQLSQDQATVLLQLLAQAYMDKASLDPDGQTQWYTQALSCYETLSSQTVTSATTMQNYATVLRYLERYTEAEAILLDLVEQNPQNYQVYMNLTFLYIHWQGTLDTSVRDYSLVANYYTLATQYYQVATANGTSDMQMVYLDDLVKQLAQSGWL